VQIGPLICFIGTALVISIHQKLTTLTSVYLAYKSTSPSQFTNSPINQN
jgi:hypothetical protein